MLHDYREIYAPFTDLSVHSSSWLYEAVPAQSHQRPTTSLLLVFQRLVWLHGTERRTCAFLFKVLVTNTFHEQRKRTSSSSLACSSRYFRNGPSSTKYPRPVHREMSSGSQFFHRLRRLKFASMLLNFV